MACVCILFACTGFLTKNKMATKKHMPKHIVLMYFHYLWSVSLSGPIPAIPPIGLSWRCFASCATSVCGAFIPRISTFTREGLQEMIALTWVVLIETNPFNMHIASLIAYHFGHKHCHNKGYLNFLGKSKPDCYVQYSLYTNQMYICICNHLHTHSLV